MLVGYCVRLQVGEFVLVGLAFALPGWQHLLLAVGCINAATLLLYPIVAESARWLLSHGRTDEATAILERIANSNKSSMPAHVMISSSSQSQLQAVRQEAAEEGVHCKDLAMDDSQREEPVGLFALLREWHLAFRLLVLLLNWFALFLNYYGIAMGSGGIPGSM
jgi:hypothetical protein